MYAKLDSQAKEVVVYLNKAVLVGEIDGKKRATRRIYTNETEIVTRWPIGDQPDHYQVGLMGDDAEKIMSWAREQNEQINQAFAKNMQQKLAGGTPVIVGSAAHKKIKDQDLEGFRADAKTGEFCGIIQGARSIASVMTEPEPEPEPEPVKPQETEKTDTQILPSLVTDQLNSVATGLLQAISNAVDEGQGVTHEEIYNLYEAERQIYYTLTRGLGIKANEYETNRRKTAEKRYNETKKGRFGMALRQAADMLKDD